jgi:dynein-related subfamily AAA family protein
MPVGERQLLLPSELEAAMLGCFKAGRAPMVHGDPGIGKSKLTQKIADQMFAEKYGYRVLPNGTIEQKGPNPRKPKSLETTWEPVPADFDRPWFRDIRAAQIADVDLRGLPTVNGDGRAHWAIPDWLPRDPRGGVTFLDEINRGQESTQNALFQWVTDYRIGDYFMPKTWHVCAAVNDQDVGARKMSSALLARFNHYDFGISKSNVGDWMAEWCQHAVIRGFHPWVIAFLRSFPGAIAEYDPKARVSPNPRAWEYISDILSSGPMSKAVRFAHFAGNLGEGRAVEFAGFVDMYEKLPSVDAILMSPDKAQVPAEPSLQYAVSAALARRSTDDNFGKVIKYMGRMPSEFGVMCVKDAVDRNPGLQGTADFTQWAVQHPQAF